MKHKDAISQTYLERDRRALPELIRRAKNMCSWPTTMNKLYEIAAELPTDKFYICDVAACRYVSKRILHKKKKNFSNPFKQRLFEALYDEVEEMMKKEKYKKLGYITTTIMALGHPAPCIGLTPYVIGVILRRTQKYNKHKRHEKV